MELIRTFSTSNDEIKLATAVYFGSTVNLCVYVKTSPSQNAPKSKRPRIGRNVPITFSASYSPSAMVMYVSKLPWTRVRFGPVPLASCGILATKGSGVNSPAAVSFTVFSQTPRGSIVAQW